ncbi:hypothetical protein M3P05_00065 [Sansalvadorimonas sp. 2012CJ34-2]|uniref:Uncharacterized protein n=1 Tax=Parendozoicomonas callyspongiae TaxID=2942213 RepID=A0ABT0PC58_9GAMM|nr:hypothetical protein [Sansalvadorimonas sp. 2012CJ34-2]MCL6268342.1 hypothetical protein [Sansalvadorimonas sp. 2012CJ34-2]
MMKPAAILLIFCQWLFASVSLYAHSMDLGHDSLEDVHVHFEQSSEPASQEADSDNSPHIHFSLDPVVHHLTFNSNHISSWSLLGDQHWYNQIYQPPLPPPTSYPLKDYSNTDRKHVLRQGAPVCKETLRNICYFVQFHG